MLRSIFSLIQNIIDSDKEYSNKKSSTVVYLVATPEHGLNMDLEIDGKPRENLKTIQERDAEESTSSFKITTEQGDTVTCRHHTEKRIVPVRSVRKEEEKLCEEYKEQVGQRASFANEEIVGDRDGVGRDVKVEGVEEPTVRDVLAQLPQKQVKILQKDKDQISALMEQIQKMKMGMERLQEIAQQFNTSDQFKKDVDFLSKNVNAALQTPKAESEHKNLQKPL